MMRFRYTILYVPDVRASLDFYTRAFGFEIGLLSDAGDYGELVTGDTKLAFSSIALMRQIGKAVAEAPPEKPSFELAFETDDVAAALARATAAGGILVQGVTRMEWGQELAYIRAPEGTLVEICSPVGAS